MNQWSKNSDYFAWTILNI